LTEDMLVTRLNLITSEINHEDDLMGQRTTWLVMSQSFLFGAYASLVGRPATAAVEHMIRLLDLMIPLVGLVLPILVLPALGAAISMVWQLRADRERIYAMLEGKGVEGSKHQSNMVLILGQSLPVAAGLGFVLAWIIILLES